MSGAPHRHGCHNRTPYRETVKVQDGWLRSIVQVGNRAAEQQTRHMVEVPFRMARACQYTRSALGQGDASCSGCAHRADRADEGTP